jgi:hypothetical protein
MCLKTDSLYGHIVEETDKGLVYKDDGTKVTDETLRPCLGCHAKIERGSHDPCIANLPGTYMACCGHGLDRTPEHNRPNGYVAFKDGRTIEFSGLFGGERIRQAVDAALAGEELPEGFMYGTRMWWEGLSDAQRQWVWDRVGASLPPLVSQVAQPSEAYLNGKAPWWDGLTDDEREQVKALIPASIAALVEQALAQA